MKLLKWLQACLLVYLRRLSATNGKTLCFVFVGVFAVLLASLLGFAATVCILLLAAGILPLLNADVKREIDQEYTSRK